MFKIFKLSAGEKTVLVGGVRTKPEAETLIETELKKYEHSGYNKEHAYSWGRSDSDGEDVRLWFEGETK
jgi:hypothetical protein